MSGVIDAASVRVDRALEACYAAEAEVVAAALHLLVLRAREAHPTSVAVLLDWSDQGDFLDVRRLEGLDGAEIEWSDEESLGWNFGGHLEARWMTFMSCQVREPAQGPFRLSIEPTLDHFNRLEGL
ncbi:hypothetical protein [Nocardioides limicola]|uniref:hypothetical protein n=1 Tax=Nocardioides limicola TaxID=2803368 RepID=UPI00193B45D0|nr:hypothetical protein [Nocardioides sp. DJM-14]